MVDGVLVLRVIFLACAFALTGIIVWIFHEGWDEE